MIRPAAPQHDREESVPYEVIKEAYQWNLAGIDWIMSLQNDPEGLKGVIYAEELHWGCAGIALAISASSLCAAGIAASGTPEQIGRWIPEVVGTKEEPKLGAYAVTEPQAGSDVKSLRTTAKRDGDDWILNGTKTFISNGGIADVTVVVATVDPELGHRGQASFVVTKDNPGLRSARRSRSSGSVPRKPPRSCSRTAGFPATRCWAARRSSRRSSSAHAPASARRPSGALATFEITRPTVGASALGIAQAAYEWTLEYLSGRYDNGRPLLEEQRIQQVIADVATEIEAARLLVWRAAWMGRNGVPMTGGQGSMSKLKGGDVTMWATTTLMDLVGPEAQSTDCPLEKWFRDAKIYQIFEGTAQIQRLVIARMQAAEYAERLQFAKEVAAIERRDHPQAPGNAPSETPAADQREKVATTAAARRRRERLGLAARLRWARLHQHGHHHERLDVRRAENRRRMLVALAINVAMLAATIVGGILANSLALLADGGHLASDVAAIGIALIAARLASVAPTAARTYGLQRSEILGALINGIGLVVVSALIVFEAIARFSDPPDVGGVGVLVLGLFGLAGNAAATAVLLRGEREDLNLEAVLRHSVGDALSSVGVVVAGVIVLATGWNVADPIASLLIAGLIAASSWRLLKEPLDVLMEAAPPGMDAREIGEALAADADVVEVHDLHVWTVTSGFPALSAHVAVCRGCDRDLVRRRLEQLLGRPLRHPPHDPPGRARGRDRRAAPGRAP